MNIIVEADFDGFFEGLTRQIVQGIAHHRYETVIVHASPFVPDALAIMQVNETTVKLLWYSPLRRGFGEFTKEDFAEVRELLSVLEGSPLDTVNRQRSGSI